jgi:hypothetical protein
MRPRRDEPVQNQHHKTHRRMDHHHSLRHQEKEHSSHHQAQDSSCLHCQRRHAAQATSPTHPADHAKLPANAFWTTNSVVVDPTSGASLECTQLKLGPDSKPWIQAAANKIGRLVPQEASNRTCPIELKRSASFTSTWCCSSQMVAKPPTSACAPATARRKLTAHRKLTPTEN